MSPLNAILFTFIVGIVSNSAFGDVSIVSQTKSSEVTEKLKNVVNNIFNNSDIKYSFNEKVLPEAKLLLSIGSEGYKATINENKSTITHIALFFPPNLTPDRNNTSNIIPFYSEPAPKNVIDFLSKNFKGSRIGIIYTQKDNYIKELKSESAGRQIELVEQELSGSIYKTISELVAKKIHVILINKNEEIYTKENIIYVLDTLYRKRIPAIATSRSLLNVGAIATITTDNKIIIEELNKTILTAAQEGINDDVISDIRGISGYNSTFRIDINNEMESFYGYDLQEVD